MSKDEKADFLNYVEKYLKPFNASANEIKAALDMFDSGVEI